MEVRYYGWPIPMEKYIVSYGSRMKQRLKKKKNQCLWICLKIHFSGFILHNYFGPLAPGTYRLFSAFLALTPFWMLTLNLNNDIFIESYVFAF